MKLVRFIITSWFILLLVSCSLNLNTATTPTTMIIQTPTIEPTITTTPRLLPVYYGTPLPLSNEIITATNFKDLHEFGRWGIGLVRQIVFSTENKTIAVGTSLGIYLFDSNTHELINSNREIFGIMNIDYSPDNKIIAIASQILDQVILLDSKTLEIISKYQWTGEELWTRDLFYLNKDRIIVGINQAGAYLLNLKNGQFMLLKKWDGGRIAVSHDRDLIAVSGYHYDNHEIIQEDTTIWNSSSLENEPLKIIKGAHASQFFKFSPDGNLLGTQNGDEIKFWDVETGIYKSRIKNIGGIGGPADCHFSRDGNYFYVIIYVMNRSPRIKVWDIKNTSVPKYLVDYEISARKIFLSNDGKFTVDDSLEIYDLQNKFVKITELIEQRFYNDFFISPESKYIAMPEISTKNSVDIGIYNLIDGKLISTLIGHETIYIFDICFLPKEGKLVSMGGDNTIRIWDILSGMQSQMINIRNSLIRSNLDFSNDGNLILYRSSSKDFSIWDIKNNELFIRLQPQGRWIENVSFSKDSSLIYVVSYDKNYEAYLEIFDINGQFIEKILLPDFKINKYTHFSPQGKYLGYRNNNANFIVLDIEQNEFIRLDRYSQFTFFDFSHDESMLMVIDDQNVYIYDLQTNKRNSIKLDMASILECENCGGGWTISHFSPDGKLLITTSDDTLRIWEVP